MHTRMSLGGEASLRRTGCKPLLKEWRNAHGVAVFRLLGTLDSCEDNRGEYRPGKPSACATSDGILEAV